MNNFEVIIGIEIHIELNTKTKMFSSALNDFHAEHNTLASVVDLAYPGTLPVVNKGAIQKAIKLAKALNMSIDSELHFDRKNYFYPDLPKGFQITQDRRPIAKHGAIPISDKNIAIAHFHLEEDTAKTINDKGMTLLNYNRAGVPLVEIVTEPVIRSSKEAVEYIDAIRQLASSLDISDAKMEEGSLRADINISLRPYGQTTFGTKVEIKNLNSLGNVEKGIADEIAKQSRALIYGEEIFQATKRFDESTQETVIMRVKTGVADYKFFAEPNIPPIALDQTWVDSIAINELPWNRKARYESYGIDKDLVDKLMSDLERADYFDAIDFHDKLLTAKIFFAELVQQANARNKKVSELGVDQQQIAKLLSYLEAGMISGKHIKEIVPLMISSGQSVDQIIRSNNFRQISDEKVLTELITKIISANKAFVEENQQRPERVFKNLLGLLMKETDGQANPVLSNKILEKLLEV